jgi:hypothetical protein
VTIYHTAFLELNLNRECFTRQGLHFNGRGKELVTKQVVSQINQSFSNRAQTLISLMWEKELNKMTTIMVAGNGQENQKNTLTSTERENRHTDTSYYEVSLPRISTREWRVPMTRTNDFLW